MRSSISPHRLVSSDALALFIQAQHALHVNQEQLGRHLGASKRTVSRWVARRASPTITQVTKLAKLVFPTDPALAAQLAVAADETLESLGLVVPPLPPPVAPPAPELPRRLIVQAVVCAAADALEAPPAKVRPAVLAAFRVARELGMSVEQVEAALTSKVAPAPTKP